MPRSATLCFTTRVLSAQISVGLGPDDEGTRWLAVSPSEGELQPAEEMMLTLQACITAQTAEVEAHLDECVGGGASHSRAEAGGRRRPFPLHHRKVPALVLGNQKVHQW
eukprot:TRINITY_DN7533_c1_g4_i1.p2 TRINITY_DN7533_c1_g4~~TRINITY_DN7533_c1_g4_i1.p2  ORF type:complete len:109 (-),score=27.38 TRINITY_DN7533_c1_g4_i1:127-453(-)